MSTFDSSTCAVLMWLLLAFQFGFIYLFIYLFISFIAKHKVYQNIKINLSVCLQMAQKEQVSNNW